MSLTFIDWFAGIGGFRMGMEAVGHKCLGFCEFDKYAVASYTAMHLITEEQRAYLATLRERERVKEILKEEYKNGEWFRNDVRTVKGSEVPMADVWCFGFPCFPSGTLILTKDKGYIPIEDIRVGMEVLTHKGRWRKVLKIGTNYGKTVILKGNHYGLECTPNHPIYSSGEKKDYSYKADGTRNNKIVLTDEKSWIPAEEMNGKLWAIPNSVEEIPIPHPVDNKTHAHNKMPKFNTAFFYFIGRWLGDGWVQNTQRSGRPEGQTVGKIFLCDSFDKEDELKKTLDDIDVSYTLTHERTATKVCFTNHILCDWLIENFNQYSSMKTIPSWVFGVKPEWRQAILDGLFDTDGCKIRSSGDVHKITTTSKKLAESIRLLGEIQGYLTSIHKVVKDSKTTIEGRVVNQKDYYDVRLTLSKTKTHLADDLHGWYRCKEIVPTHEEKTVYNFEVEEDNSYVADGIVVHNCQDISVAGKQRGVREGTRSGLFFQIVRILKETKEEARPRYLFIENVKNLLSINKGWDFATVLSELAEIGYDCQWQVLNSKNFGVPQNRERVFIIANLRDRGGSEVFPIGGTDQKNSVDVIGHRKNYRRNLQTYSPNGLTETLDTAQGGGRNFNVALEVMGNQESSNGKIHQHSKVYSDNGLSPTLVARGKGNLRPKVGIHQIGQSVYTASGKTGQKTGIHDIQGQVGSMLATQYKEPPRIAIPVITPDRANKRQNGRRFKENGDPSFTLTSQDKHGVAIGVDIDE